MPGGQFFGGLAQLLDVLFRAATKLREIKEQKRRRETACDLIAACLLAEELVQKGKALMELAGPDPIKKVTDMNTEKRIAYVAECERLLHGQLKRLAGLSSLLEDVPILQLLDIVLKRELDAIIGTKEKGLMAIAAPLGIYLTLGAPSEQGEVKMYGKTLASFRYQGDIIALLFGGDPTASTLEIDKISAVDNFNELLNAAERLSKHVNQLLSKEEIILLAREARKRKDSVIT
jgi:hypothetical protein